MSPKVHFWIWDQKPNESDTEGSGYVICGLETVEKTTDDKKTLTCRKCRTILDRKTNPTEIEKLMRWIMNMDGDPDDEEQLKRHLRNMARRAVRDWVSGKGETAHSSFEKKWGFLPWR